MSMMRRVEKSSISRHRLSNNLQTSEIFMTNAEGKYPKLNCMLKEDDFYFILLAEICNPITNVLHRLPKNCCKRKLRSLLLIAFRLLDFEISGKIRREVLTIFFRTQK